MTDDEVLTLYERTVDGVYRYATRLTGGDRTWADELVQETYLHLLRRVRAGESAAVDVGWLIVSCRHRFLDQVKQERRRRDRERRSAEPAHSDVGAGGRTVEALDQLPADQRAVLVLHYVDELTVAEIAREIGRSVHATESLLVRARAALRTALAKGARP
jgi:RNA polymerase sigma-70 factor, ECF subfamily